MMLAEDRVAGSLRPVAMGIAGLTVAALALVPTDLFGPARIALDVFGAAVILWTFTRLDAAWVALVAAMLLIFTGAAREDAMFAMLGHDVIWLMIGAFVIGGAIDASGLSARLAGAVARRAANIRQLFWLTTTVLVPLTFLIPSTSGRAAAVLPLLRAIPEGQEMERLRRAYSLLIPVVILLATSAALTGAGSHLLLEELLVQRLGDRFGFGAWALWGLPFAVAASAMACVAVLRLFLTHSERETPLPVMTSTPQPFSPPERRVVAIVGVTLALWFTSAWHDIGIAMVAVLAMLTLTAPRLGVLPFKAAVKAVNWQLVLFVGGAMLLGQALIDTQAASWVMDHAFSFAGLDSNGAALPELAVISGLALVSLGSHLVMTSHVARAAALGPPLLLFAQTAGVNPIAVLFIGAVGMNYCITLPVCSKALMVFQDAKGAGFAPHDLLRLSAVLAPANALLMVAAYFGWWQWTGLGLIP